jgi:hypothetical protein
MLPGNALAIDAYDPTRVITTRPPNCDLARFMGTNHTNREIGTAITRLGSAMTFLAIAEIGGDIPVLVEKGCPLFVARAGFPLPETSLPQRRLGRDTSLYGRVGVALQS